jgi:hypothetical protein
MTKNSTQAHRCEAPARTQEARLTKLPDEQLAHVQGGGWRFQRALSIAEDPSMGPAAL